MLKNRMTREDILGHKLDFECKRAKTLSHQYGKDDNRAFCYGLYQDKTCNIQEKCLYCRAYCENAEPLEEK